MKTLPLLTSQLITTRAISTYDSHSPRYENLHSLPLNHNPIDPPWNNNKNGDTLPILKINSCLQAFSDL